MAAAEAPSVPGISRREFLYYVWAASIALYTGEFLALIIWYAIPIIREGEFGSVIPVNPDRLPPVNDAPTNFSEGRFWLVNLDTTSSEGVERMYRASDEASPIQGVAAIYKVCTHLGCIYSWNAATNRFECPCHGSKYRLDGRRIQSPAPRSLDRFGVTLVYADGSETAAETDDGGFFLPVVIDESKTLAEIRVDTGDRADGPITTLLSEVVPA
ncbi:MAG: Rieske 2Fe-2S domain-containing protein [Ardenticatenaceae bacterium]|nr:Rieske 2Fe-2S domain-containing protein [Ardenticatenaceae bacterium]